MRNLATALASASLLSLAACGGGGSGGSVATLGSIAPPAVNVGTLTPTPTPTSAATNLLDVAVATDYAALGGFQSLSIAALTGASLYRGNANQVSSTDSKINYSPRDGVFTLTVADTSSGVTRNVRFQDPAHRTADGLELEVPRLSGVNYLSALDGTAPTTFFYQRPGDGPQFVSLAGFVHTEVTKTPEVDDIEGTSIEHGAFVFGTRTPSLQVPITGTGSYAGNFLATMVGTKFDQGGRANAFQWLTGSSTVNVDFAAKTVGLALAGQVLDAAVQNVPVANTALNLPGGSTFAATGSARIDYARSGGFTGTFGSAGFTVGGRSVPVDFTAVNPTTSVAGASSIDGTFYGPNAVNVGGSFRITGGMPDQRVDILGAFNGAK